MFIERKREGLQVWKKGVIKRDLFYSLRGKPYKTHVFQLFLMMNYEAFGDKGQRNNFLNACHCSLINKETEEAKELTVNSNALCNITELSLSGDSFVFVMKKVDNTFKNECIQFYGKFNSFNEPIAFKSKMKELMSQFMKEIASHHKLMSQMLTFDKKIKQKKETNI